MGVRPMSRLLAAVLAVVVVLLGASAGGCGGRPAGSGAPDAPDVPAAELPAFTVGARLHAGDDEVTLAAPAAAPPNGWLSPVTVPSPDREYLIYRTWTVHGDAGRPALRLRHLASGTDTVFCDGAASLAWSGDGRIGYAAGGDDRPGAAWTARILVRPSLTGPDQVWTTDRRHYVVAAWAGPHLLAYDLDQPAQPRLLAFDGPGRARPLGPGVLVAVSPDGTAVFLAETGDTETPHVRVVEVRTGATRARLHLAGTGIAGVGHAGDWAGDLVVAAGVPDPLIFRVAADSIRVEARLSLDAVAHPYGLREPRLVGNVVIAWAATDAGQDPPTAIVRCPLATRACAAGETFAPPAAHPVRNPSRP